MSTFLVVTNLSVSSQNALDYACAFAYGKPVRIVLLHVFAFSAGFAGDGIGLAALSEVSAYDESVLASEKERVAALYPNVELETRMVAGQFLASLQEEVTTEDAKLVVMGAEGDYKDLMSWDNHIIDAFIDLLVPVLMVPATLRFAGIQQMAFACNYKREDLTGPVQTLRRLLARTGGRLHFVHINKGNTPLQPDELEWKARWQNELVEEDVVFEEPEGDSVVGVLDEFCSVHAINLLVIRPHRAGIWNTIFNASETLDIAHMNNLPILALRGGGA